jgi:hypothetical protein
MKQLYEWGFWLGAATLLSSAGKFLDEYHIRHETKSKARDILVRAFFYLETFSVPDTGRSVARRMRQLGSRFGWRGVVALPILGFFAIVTSLVLLHIDFSDFDDIDLHELPDLLLGILGAFVAYIPYTAYNFSLAALAPLPAALCGWFILRFITDTARDFVALFVALLSPIVLVLSLFPVLGLLQLTGQGGIYGGAFSVIASVFLILPFVFLSTALIFLIASRAILQALRFVAMRVFDAASDPKRSPFAYGSTFLSILVLFAKLLLQFTNA